MQAAFDLYKMFRSLAEEQSDRFVLKLEAVVELAGANPLEYQWDGRNFVRQSDDDIERRTAAYHAVEHARDEALQKAQHTLFGAISTS